MIFPRLIIADEYRPGKIPAGVLIAGVLREKGYNLRLFAGSVDEISLRSLQLMCNQPVTLLDPYLCGEKENLRWLFQQAASEDALNLIITNLGGRWTEESPFRLSKECLLLSEWLDCDFIPVVYGDTAANIVAKTIAEIAAQCSKTDPQVKVHSVLYRSAINHREYELLDRAAGRQVSWTTLGYIPRNFERDTPIITDLCSERSHNSLFQIRSAARQLKNMEDIVIWPFFSALAQAAPVWPLQSALAPPLEEKVRIAVVRSDALTLGGAGTELLLKTMGCELVDAPIDGEVNGAGVHGIYIPHGLGFMVLPKLFSNIGLKTLITRGGTGEFFLLAEGGAAPILGEKIDMASGASVRGMGILPFKSTYKANSFGAPFKVHASAKSRNSLIRGASEYVRGYTSANLSMVSSEDGEPCWDIKEQYGDKIIMSDCWSNRRALATALRPEFWGCPKSFRRWLEG